MQVSPMFRYPRELLGFKVLRMLQLPTAAVLTITGTSTTPVVSLAIDPEKNPEKVSDSRTHLLPAVGLKIRIDCRERLELAA